MKSDLHETFRISFWVSPKMTQHVKDDPILQVSSQEPSASSKYDFEDGGVLEALLNMLESWNLVHKSRITYQDDPWRQGWPHPPSLQSGTFSVLQVWLRGRGVLDTLLFMLESWDLAHESRIPYHEDPWCQGWPYPPSILQCPPSMTLSLKISMCPVSHLCMILVLVI